MKLGSFNDPRFLASWSKVYSETKELSPRLAYKTKSLNDYLVGQNKRFLELRDGILKKHGKKDEKGELIVKDGNIEFENSSLNDVNKDFLELLGTDLEPAPPSRIKLEELEKDNIKLSGPDIAVLGELLDFSDETKPALALVPSN